MKVEDMEIAFTFHMILLSSTLIYALLIEFFHRINKYYALINFIVQGKSPFS